MHEARPGTDGYLDAFMDGFEFVLLAMRGRVAEGTLPPDEADRLEELVAEYARIPRAYRERREQAATQKLPISGPFRAELSAIPTN